MPYNPNVARKLSPEHEAGAEAQKEARQPNKNLEVAPEERSRLAKLRKEEKAESGGKVAEIQAGLNLKKLQQTLGVKHLTDPEAMLHAVILDRQATPAKLKVAHDYVEAQNQALIQGLESIADKAERVKTQRKIEKNFDLISKIEDTLNIVQQENLSKKPDDVSRILNRELLRDMDLEQGVADSIYSLENEQKQLDAEQDSLEKKISEMTGGLSPNEYLRSLTEGRSTGFPMLGHRLKSWFAKISGGENQALLADKWRDNNQRLAQVESQLQSLRPRKAEKPAETHAPSAEISGAELHLKLDKRIEALEDEIETKGRVWHVSGQPREMTEELSALNNELSKLKAEKEADFAARRQRSAEETARKKAVRKEAEPVELSVDEFIGEEEVSGVREKPRATPPPISESPAFKKRKAEEERMRREAEEAFEVRKKQEAELKEREVFDANVARTKEVMGDSRAAQILDNVFTQMGMQLTKHEIDNNVGLWSKATGEQRENAMNFVFKCADRQSAIVAGNAKLQKKLEAELEALAKKINIASAKLAYEPSGAGVGFTMETARNEQARAAGRIAGRETAARSRQRVNIAPNATEAIDVEAIEHDSGRTIQEVTDEKASEEFSTQLNEEIEEGRKTNIRESVKKSLKERMRTRGMAVSGGTDIEAGAKAAKKIVAENDARIAEQLSRIKEAVPQAEEQDPVFERNVNRAKDILGNDRAREMMNAVFLQMGVLKLNEAQDTDPWTEATAEQRDQALEFVFKCADRQEAEVNGNKKLQTKLEGEIDKLAKSMGLDVKAARTIYATPAKRAPSNSFNTGAREDQRRAGRRTTGV